VRWSRPDRIPIDEEENHPVFTALGLLILGFAFLVLVGTFWWIARLVGRRATARDQDELIAAAPPGGKGFGGRFALILAAVGTALFLWPLPSLALCFGAIYYGAVAMRLQWRYHGTVNYPGAAGLVFGASSVGLHLIGALGYLNLAPGG
jgi:hypothetical protein